MNQSTSVDAYIENFPVEVQNILQQIRNTISQVAPEAKETIAYGIPTFTLNENLVHFGTLNIISVSIQCLQVIKSFSDECALLCAQRVGSFIFEQAKRMLRRNAGLS